MYSTYDVQTGLQHQLTSGSDVFKHYVAVIEDPCGYARMACSQSRQRGWSQQISGLSRFAFDVRVCCRRALYGSAGSQGELPVFEAYVQTDLFRFFTSL